MRKYNPATGLTESTFDRLGTKSVIVDYPSLENPKVITSTVSFGDNSGYRSPNSFVAEDGNIYQATQRDSKGSHILKINTNNEYDNSYIFSLDAALGVKMHTLTVGGMRATVSLMRFIPTMAPSRATLLAWT